MSKKAKRDPLQYRRMLRSSSHTPHAPPPVRDIQEELEIKTWLKLFGKVESAW